MINIPGSLCVSLWKQGQGPLYPQQPLVSSKDQYSYIGAQSCQSPLEFFATSK